MKYSKEQQQILDECDKNLYIAAGPGSGKSTTLAGITEELLKNPTNSILLITFTNKAARSIMGKVDNLDAERISGGTFHSLSYRTMRQGGRNFHICDENKKRLIIKRIFDCRKDKDKFERIYGKISRLKSHYPVNRSDPDLQRYQNELAKYNMLDFDDIINVGIEYLKNPITKKPSATHILVDELQDTSQNQLEFLVALQAATSCKMIGVGDDDQCHLSGDRILTTDGHIDVKDINETHNVPCYDGHGKVYGTKDPHGYRVLAKASRKYTGKIYNIHVDGDQVNVTYNHRCYASFNDNVKTKYVTYLMQKNNKFRIGQCKLFIKNTFHLGTRARLEGADHCWILGVHNTRGEALEKEAILAAKYCIPTVTFKENTSSKYFKQDTLDRIFAAIPDDTMLKDAELLLHNYNRYIDFPFWSKQTNEKKGKREFFVTRACNLIADIMTTGKFNNKTIRRHSIDNILVTNVKDVLVYSIEVDTFHNYFSNNILLGNCVYEWRGARYKNVEDFIKRFGAEVMELGVNFRSTSKIVHKSRQLIERNKDRIKKDLRSNTMEPGLVHCYGGNNPWDEVTYVVSLLRSRKDMEVAILYRNRANKHRLEAELRRNNIRYTVNDSTEITDRSAFRCLISCLRMATGRYDIYDMEDGSRGLKRLAKGTIDKIRKNVKNANDIEMDSKVRALACDDGRVKSGTSELRKIQKEFKSMEHEPLNKFIEKLDTHMINSFDIPKEIKEFLLEVSKSYVATPSDVDSLINDFGLDPDDEVKDEDALIELSTIHGYKGCEREIVIIPWCNWDFKPDDNTKNILEAERRLFYVAVTRAKSELYLTYSGFMKPIFVRELMK